MSRVSRQASSTAAERHGQTSADQSTQGSSARLRWLPALLLLGGLIVLARSLPVATGIDRLERWVGGLGLFGMVVFGAVYVAAAMLFVPGAALTIAAGAVFGLVGGTVTVSAASTTAAALGFLCARHLLRRRVEELARRHRAFSAIDRAIGDGSWRIIALLRLVPLFPFSAGNYLLGLTSARFWQYLAASWLFMLPGTLMYVYIGFLGVETLDAASSADAAVGVGRVVLLAAGLLALVLATIYLTRLAKRRLHESAPADDFIPATTSAGPGRRVTGALWLGVVVVVAMAAWASVNKDRLAGLFGPPVVRSREAFAGTQAATFFDHSAFTDLLRRFVDADGRVDYPGLCGEPGSLDDYVASVAEVPLEPLGRDGQLALLINAYNAFTLRLICDHYPIDSIRDIPEEQRWTARRWRLGGRTISLDQLENELIRPNFAEPRIHFALVCAAIGCPRLRTEAYVADRLDDQLAEQARGVHLNERWFRFDPDAGRVELTQLYQWYGADFEQAAGSVLAYVGRQVAAVQQHLEGGRGLEIGYLPYDWSLNQQKPR